MNARHILQQIRRELRVDIRERAREQEFPSGYEPGMRHSRSGAYTMMRDDGIAELGSGPNAAVLADGPNQQVTVKGNAISLNGRYIHLHAPPGGLYFGYQRFNPFWQSLPGDIISPFWKAPLISRAPGSWELLSRIPFLTGTVSSPTPVFLGEFLQTIPLFGPNEQLLVISRNIASLIRSLTQ